MQDFLSSPYAKYIESVLSALLLGGAGNAYLAASNNLHSFGEGMGVQIAAVVINLVWDHIVKPYLAKLTD